MATDATHRPASTFVAPGGSGKGSEDGVASTCRVRGTARWRAAESGLGTPASPSMSRATHPYVSRQIAGFAIPGQPRLSRSHGESQPCLVVGTVAAFSLTRSAQARGASGRGFS